MAIIRGTFSPLVRALTNAGIITEPNNVRRVTIVIAADEAVTVTVEQWADGDAVESIVKMLQVIPDE